MGTKVVNNKTRMAEIESDLIARRKQAEDAGSQEQQMSEQ
jgi:hypothetical protein